MLALIGIFLVAVLLNCFFIKNKAQCYGSKHCSKGHRGKTSFHHHSFSPVVSIISSYISSLSQISLHVLKAKKGPNLKSGQNFYYFQLFFTIKLVGERKCISPFGNISFVQTERWWNLCSKKSGKYKMQKQGLGNLDIICFHGRYYNKIKRSRKVFHLRIRKQFSFIQVLLF